MAEDNTVHALILDQMKRNEDSLIRIFDKLDEQGSTLGRLTTTVEIHQKYSENLEKEQKSQLKKLGEIDEELESINEHVNEVKLWVKILKPTKMKMTIAAALLSYFGGSQIIQIRSIQELINPKLSTQKGGAITAPKKSDIVPQ